jgi:hypothetical protein
MEENIKLLFFYYLVIPQIDLAILRPLFPFLQFVPGPGQQQDGQGDLGRTDGKIEILKPMAAADHARLYENPGHEARARKVTGDLFDHHH